MDLSLILEIMIHLLVSFGLAVCLGYFGLPLLHKIKAAQHVRAEGPEAHLQKTGTPTMGGWFFIIAIFMSMLVSNFFIGGTPESSWFYVSALLLYAIIGFVDDFLKVILKQNMGLTSLQKLLLQIVMIGGLLYFFREHFADTSINFFLFELTLSPVMYFAFIIVWFVGFSNATNVTDGVDGLLTVTSIIAFTTFAVIAVLSGSYFTMLFCVIVIGSLLGFLVFNWNPARVFMGDTGSLAIGAMLAALSVELDAQFLLLITGIVFVVETASVIIQVTYFKYTRSKYGEGKRIFLMSPLHHHLELKGYKEKKVVLVLSILGVAGGVISVLLFSLQ